MKELIIDLSTGGGAQALHMDEFPLGFLGKMSMERASTIVFNESTQKWDIVVDDECGVSTMSLLPSYEKAREFEIEWLQACRRLSVFPGSIDGVHLAAHISGNTKYLRVE